jgi:hypothetical protein
MWTRWNTHTIVSAEADDVIDVLTRVEAIHGWSPVAFDLDDLAERHLHTGCRARVIGRLAGFGVAFDVEVEEATHERLALLASGPVELDVDYRVEPTDLGTSVTAEVSVRSAGGTTGRLIARAVNTLLAAGALDRALGRIATEAEASSADMALAA